MAPLAILGKFWKIRSEASEMLLKEAAFSACRSRTSNMANSVLMRTVHNWVPERLIALE